MTQQDCNKTRERMDEIVQDIEPDGTSNYWAVRRHLAAKNICLFIDDTTEAEIATAVEEAIRLKISDWENTWMEADALLAMAKLLVDENIGNKLVLQTLQKRLVAAKIVKLSTNRDRIETHEKALRNNRRISRGVIH